MKQDKHYPKVSVIIPTFNRARTLGKTLNSILKQTYSNYDVLVIDDGSTDDTKEVINSLSRQRLKYIGYKKNRGPSFARNKGIKNSNSDLVAFLDSDDTSLPNRLEMQVNTFKKLPEDVGMVYSDFIEINNRKKTYRKSPDLSKKYKDLYKQALSYKLKGIGMSTAMIKRECFSEIGFFDTNLQRYIDLELFIRLSKKYRIYRIPKPLITSYRLSVSVSQNEDKLLSAQKYILKKYKNDIVRNRSIYAKHLFVIGNNYFRNGKLEKGKIFVTHSIKYSPGNIIYLSTYISMLLGKNIYTNFVNLKRRYFKNL